MSAYIAPLIKDNHISRFSFHAPSLMNTFNGKVALVTGGNSGLGFEAAAQLADAGFGTIILAARNKAKGEQASKLLTERTGKDVFETLAMDLYPIKGSGEPTSRPKSGKGEQTSKMFHRLHQRYPKLIPDPKGTEIGAYRRKETVITNGFNA